MASITIRNLDDKLKARLRVRAAQHDNSMEEEAREILRSALAIRAAVPRNLATVIHSRFARIEGAKAPAPVHERDPMRDPPNFD